MEAAGSQQGAGRATYVIAALLAAVTAAVFWPVSGFEFLHLDDRQYVANNRAIAGGLSGAAVRWAFTSLAAGNWHPLTWLSHALDVSLFGLSPGPHHLENVAWHAAAAVLLLLFLRLATGALWRSALVAAFFALHPLRVESVAWVAERKDVLAGALLMLTLLAYRAYALRPGGARYALVVGTFALGLMAKPMLVSAPLVLLVLDFWPLGRWRALRKRCLVEKLPLVALSAGVGTVTLVAQTRLGAVAPIEVLPVAVRFENAAVATIAYLGKALWPHPLAPYYPLDEAGPPLWEVAVATALLLALVVVAVRVRRRAPYVAAGLAWYYLTLLPVSGVVQAGQQSLADRYTYIPLIGVFFLAAWGCDALLSARLERPIVALAAAALLVPAVLVTRSYLPKWKDSMTLFTHAIEAVPGNWYMHYNLGILTAAGGDFRGAIEHYAECVRLRPGFWPAHNNLGLLQASTGRGAAAEQSLLTALRINPALSEARLNLGLLYLGEGRREQALAEYDALLRLNPVFAANLGKMLAALPSRPPGGRFQQGR